jgi:hypothetical protein
MRTLLLVLFTPLAARAMCATSAWDVFPASGTKVPKNSRFIVEGYGSAQPAVLSLATRKPRLVPATGAEVPLKVVEINVGEKSITQAVLEPTTSLIEGTRYRLKIETDSKREESVLAFWTVGPADVEPPRWTKAPEAQPGEITRFGCGPAIEAHVSAAIEDASELFVRAKVTRPDGSSRQYLLPAPQNGQLAIGHGMCSGAFEIGAEKEWSLELTAVDAAGNATRALGPPLKFRGENPK